MDVRRRGDRIGTVADDTDDRPLSDAAAAQDTRRGELQQRHRVAVLSLDRDRPTATRDRADERDRAGSRGEHRAAELCADVDTAMLPARVRVRAERERSQHRPRRGPRPSVRRRGSGKRREQNQTGEKSPHEDRLR
jgi:hypothetical protein